MKTIQEKLQNLTNEQLLQLTHEVQQPTVAEDALIREVIKDSPLETTIPLLAFIGLSPALAAELADRFRRVM